MIGPVDLTLIVKCRYTYATINLFIRRRDQLIPRNTSNPPANLGLTLLILEKRSSALLNEWADAR